MWWFEDVSDKAEEHESRLMNDQSWMAHPLMLPLSDTAGCSG